MGANRTRFLGNRRLQPLGHLSGSHIGLYRNSRSTINFAAQTSARAGKSCLLVARRASPRPDTSIAVSVCTAGQLLVDSQSCFQAPE